MASSNRKTSRKSRGHGGPPEGLEAFFGPDGPLAEAMPGYELRREQLEVAEAIEHALRVGKPCLAEAGTGVGKTLAYLVPAVRAALEGKRTIISTHTISLQSQLIEKDIPLVLSLFPGAEERVSFELMKGRGNYLCKQSLNLAQGDLLLMTDPQFRRVRKWAAAEDCTGDLADLGFTFSAWSELISTPETCRGQECSFYNTCHYYRMRWAAAESSLIVVNHALFFSDLALRLTDSQSGFLPDYDHVIFDEAHHLEDVATRTFGVEFSSKRLSGVADRIKHVKGLDLDRSRLDTLEMLGSALFAPFLEAGKSSFFFDDVLPKASTRQEAEAQGSAACAAISTLQNDLLKIARDDEVIRDRADGLARICGRTREELHRLFFEKDENAIRWGEISTGGRGPRSEPRVTLYLTPISVAAVLEDALWKRMRERGGSVTMVSATLANSGGFSYQRSRLGVPADAVEAVIGSPFDFKKQAMLYVPGHLPAPEPTAAYVDRLVCEVERILLLSGGRAFLLFTSRYMLNTVFDRLVDRSPFPLFRQGDLPPGKLVEAFRASGTGCLFGTQTFWEGVDIQGESLSCVIIDKLPFAVPDSPITRARTEAITQAGGDWFRDYSIPQAQIRLKQGFGRLIRTRDDRGIVCILDSRILSRSYGSEFVKHLPPAARASLWPRVERFWRESVEPSDAQAP